jgi:hypothetical protein
LLELVAMNVKDRLRYLPPIILMLGVCACSVFDYEQPLTTSNVDEDQTVFSSESPEDTQPTLSSKSIEQNLPLSRHREKDIPPNSMTPRVVSNVEISWQVPTKGVDYYHLRYGYTANNLSRYKKIEASSLEAIEDPAYGRIYRYELSGIRSNVPLYYTLQAEKNGRLSPQSSVMRLND